MSNKEYHNLIAGNYVELLKKAEIKFGHCNFEILTVIKLNEIAGIRFENPGLLKATVAIPNKRNKDIPAISHRTAAAT